METNRDWGSSMKPITDYAPALEYGVYDSTASIVHDVPYNYPGTDTPPLQLGSCLLWKHYNPVCSSTITKCHGR